MAILYWFLQDLRLENNSGLVAACENADQADDNTANVIPLYILDTSNPWAVQGAQRWWLHHSLRALETALATRGGSLVLRHGDALSQLSTIIDQHPVDAIYFSRAYEPHNIQLQAQVNKLCARRNIVCRRFAGTLLQEPEDILSGKGTPFKVFTPFSKRFIAQLSLGPEKCLAAEQRFSPHSVHSETLGDWKLLPTNPNWAAEFTEYWQPGEAGAQQKLAESVDAVVENYGDTRDLPAKLGTSGLSPHLHFGEISPAQIWKRVCTQLEFDTALPYLRQLIWREFSYGLLLNWPHIDTQVFNPRFENFPWKEDQTALQAWQTGSTGYPIVDAGMQQLWRSGWMHNRVRMICASFLTKHLQVHWLAGARWFWDTLLDADLANNASGWQWVAGCGADAAPYFRIFNPIAQGEKFDPKGDYVRRWLPQLTAVDNKYIHKPWLAPQRQRDSFAGNYPPPIVDHATAREEALSLYKHL